MNLVSHERPGIYSVYDTSAVITSGQAAKTIGVAAKAVKGSVNSPVALSSYSSGLTVFGEDLADSPGMSTILRLLFLNGASTVIAVRVEDDAELSHYQNAFAALSKQDIQILICDSSNQAVHQALRTEIESASIARKERIAVIGGDNDSVEQLISRATALNSERMVLVGPDILDAAGKRLPGVFAAAALAAVIATEQDPAIPINGAEICGLGGLASDYDDNYIDLLIRGGVTPLESISGIISPVRGITTRTTTNGSSDITWRELTTILIVDNVIPAVRNALRNRFSRSKNTAQSRSAIRSQVVVELEKKLAAQIIEDYGEISVTASAEDPAVCLVEFSFSVAHGLNQIYLTVHITI